MKKSFTKLMSFVLVAVMCLSMIPCNVAFAETTYEVTIDSGITNGTLSADKTTAIAAGETITLTAAPVSGYKIDTLTVTDATDAPVTTVDAGNNKYTFVMPANNVTASITFEEIVYTVTVDSSIAHGTVTATPTSGTSGTTVSLTVTPEDGYELDVLTVKNGSNQNVPVSNNQFTMPASNVNVNATFVAKVLPTLNYNSNTGYVEVSFADNTVVIDKFHISDTAVDETLSTAATDIAEFANATVTANQYVTFYDENGIKLGTIQYLEGTTVRPINNELVNSVLAQTYLGDSAYDASELAAYVTAIAADNTAINALPASNQKTFLSGKVSPYVSASSMYNTIENYITQATAGNNVGTLFASYESMRTRVAALTGADNFENYLNARLDTLYGMLVSGSGVNGEANLLQAFPSMYTANAVFDIEKFVIDGTNLVVYFKQNNSWGRVLDGEMEYWIQGSLLSYVDGYYNNFNTSTSSVTFIMPDGTTTNTKTFFYPAGSIVEYDNDYLEELLEDVSINFDEFVFEWAPYFVKYSDNSTATIGLIGYGDFGYNETFWTRRDQTAFRDWYIYDVAESIYLATGCNVRISFVDWDNIVAAPTVNITSAQFGAGSGTFAQIATMLNSDFCEYDDLEFYYTVNGTARTVNISMQGNFRENHNNWTSVDRTAFDNWVENIMALSVLAYQDSDIRVRLYDRRGNLIDTYEIAYEDVAVDLEDVEDYLNDNYYYWGGIYWDFYVSSDSNGTIVDIEGDFKSNDSEWKALTTAEKKAWTQELALYIIESVPRNLTINLQNYYGITYNTYSFKRAGFVEAYNLAKELGTLEYNGLRFEPSVEYSASYVRVNLNGENWKYSSTNWKNLKSTTAFKKWVEQTVGVPAATTFNKDVYVYIYDMNERHTQSYTFSKKIANEVSTNSTLSGLQTALNKYADTLTTKKGDIDINYTVSYTTSGKTDAITIKGKMNVFSSDSRWTTKDSFEYNRLISIIKARAAWLGKTVTIQILDSRGNTVGTFSSGKNDDVFTSGSNGVYTLNSSVYNNNGNISVNKALAGYIADKATTTHLSVVFEAKDNSNVTVELNRDATTALKNEAVALSFKLNGVDVMVDCTGLTSGFDYKFSMTPSVISNSNVVNNTTVYIMSQYQITSNRNLTVTLVSNDDIKDGIVYKKNGSIWNIASSHSGTAMTIGVGRTPINFTDISSSKYANEIRKLSAYGIIEGIGNNQYAPYTVLNRAEACQILVNGFDFDTSTSGYFKDVSTSSWYYKPVMKCYTLGIVSGYGNGNFGPSDKLTYDQFLTLLVRTGEALDVNQPSYGSTNGAKCANWASDYVSIMVNLGVIDANSYDGYAKVSREVAAHLMCRYLEAIGYIA